MVENVTHLEARSAPVVWVRLSSACAAHSASESVTIKHEGTHLFRHVPFLRGMPHETHEKVLTWTQVAAVVMRQDFHS